MDVLVGVSKPQVGQMELYVSAGGENGESSASELGKRHAEEGKGMTGEGTDQPPPKKPLNAEGYRLSQQEVVLEDMEVDGEGVGETSLDSVRDLVQDIKASSHDGVPALSHIVCVSSRGSWWIWLRRRASLEVLIFCRAEARFPEARVCWAGQLASIGDSAPNKIVPSQHEHSQVPQWQQNPKAPTPF